MTPREIMLAQFAKANDPSSAGRQMPGHYGGAQHNILSLSSPVATQVLHAVGIALAAKIRGTDQVAVTELGEGSSNQGDFHEGLNFAGIHKLPVVFVVENNGYAISVPASLQSAVEDIASRAAGYDMPGVIVDGADVLACYRAGREAIARARRGDGPTLIEAKVTRLTAHSSDDQQTKYRSAEDLEEGTPPRPAAALPRRAARRQGPRRRDRGAHGRRHQGGGRGRHRLGRGPARARSGHGRAPRLRRAARAEPTMAIRTLVETIRETLADEMRRDETMIVLGEDVGRKGGVFLATDGLFAEFGGDRVIDTPLTESLIVGASIGAAVNGLRPVPEIQFADFIFPAFNQIVSEAARLRYRSNGTFGCPITIRAPYGGGVHGALYHSQSVEAFFAHVPGLKIVVPSTPYDARGLLRSSIRDPDPVLFFEHKKLYRSVRGEVPDTDYVVPLGRAQVTRAGDHVTVIAYGLMAHYSLEAAELVDGEGISAEVIDLRTLRPLDRETVLSSVKKTGKVVIVYEDNRFGGYGAEVAAIIAEEAFDYLDGPIIRVAGPDVPGVPYNHHLEDWFMVSPDQIADAIRKLAAY